MNNIKDSMNTVMRLHTALFAHVTAIFNGKKRKGDSEGDSEEDSEEDNEQHHGRTYLEFDE